MGETDVLVRGRIRPSPSSERRELDRALEGAGCAGDDADEFVTGEFGLSDYNVGKAECEAVILDAVGGKEASRQTTFDPVEGAETLLSRNNRYASRGENLKRRWRKEFSSM